MSDETPALHASRFPLLPPEREALRERFPKRIVGRFPQLVGLVLEEVRLDYARMRLPYRPELDQPNGMLHGGALATLVDTVVVPAIQSGYDEPPVAVTLDLDVRFLAPVVRQDAVAEGWVVRRGRSTVFCQAEVRSADGELACTGSLIYKIRRPR